MLLPKKKWSQPDKSKTMRAECPESALQQAADQYLEIKRIRYFRIADGFFRWVKMKAPVGIQKWFFGMFGGIPDNTCQIPLGNGYAFTLLLEIKTQDSKGRAVGQLHGKQRRDGDDWKVVRSTEQIINEIDKFELIAEDVKKYLRERYN